MNQLQRNKDTSSSSKDMSENTHTPANNSACISQSQEDDQDLDTICGIGSFRPRWLQSWATPRVYLVLYSILGVITGTYYTYRIGVITTLEKRFSFKSKTSGAIMMVDEITPIFLGAQIGYLGGKSHRPRMFGIGMLTTTLCCFASALPYFLYGPASQWTGLDIKNETGVQVCPATSAEDCEPDDRPPTMAAVLLLMLAGFLKGYGNVTFHSVGLSYMDDSAKKKNTAIYFAITIAVQLVGPALGFLLASAFLKYPENPFSEPPFPPEDPRWIGAWWIGFVMQGFLLLIFTIPLAIFPRRLPGQKKQKELAKTSISDLWESIKRLLCNPLYMAIAVNACLQVFGEVGHFLMLPKYMEQQFRMSASDANLYSGPLGITSVMLATLVGGYIVWRFKPGAKKQIGWMIVLEVISVVGFLMLMIPTCDKMEMQQFGMDGDGLILNGICNDNCNCTQKIFSPMCGSDGKTVFFSPCHAGCTEKTNTTFTDCSCAVGVGQDNGHVTEGLCASEGCWTQALTYIISMPILHFIANLLRVQYTVVMLRCIKPEDKSIALGFFETFICIFGFVPFLLIFGSLIDTTCLVWEESCGETGNCWFYDTEQFNNALHALSAGFTALSAISLIVPFCLSKRVRNLYEDDAEEDGDAAPGKDTSANVATNL